MDSPPGDQRGVEFECIKPNKEVNVASCSNTPTTYPLDEIASIRGELIANLYEKPCRNASEMEVRRKCGMWTEEMLAFYLDDKRPDGMDMSWLREYDTPENFAEYEITDQTDNGGAGDIATNNHVTTEIRRDTSDDNEDNEDNEANGHSSAVVETNENNASSEMMRLIDASDGDELIKQWSREAVSSNVRLLEADVHKKHACKLCPYTLRHQDTASASVRASLHAQSARTLYVCDFCSTSTLSLATMRQHASDNHHATASEFSFSAEAAAEGEITELYLRKRCTQMCDEPAAKAASSKCGVFCPKCQFFFANNILACKLHSVSIQKIHITQI